MWADEQIEDLKDYKLVVVQFPPYGALHIA
jgi:hypothetical protein